MIVDAFNFWKELDLLKIRLEIMNPYVDYFVLVESPLTFSGKEKPLFFAENERMFDGFRHKILHFVADNNPTGFSVTPWDREIYQRNCLKNHFLESFCGPDDFVITGDLDEIPDMRKVVPHLNGSFDIIHPMMEMYYYYLNLHKQSNWMGSKICRWKYLKDKTVDQLRNMKDIGAKIPKSGWHWSFLGNSELIKEKIGAFSHTEFDNPFFKDNVSGNVASGKDLFFRSGERMKIVPIDESFPEYIQENKENLSNIGFIKEF